MTKRHVKKAKKPVVRQHILNLGCNQRPQKSTRKALVVNADYDDYGMPDQIQTVDLNKAPWPWPDNTFDLLVAYDLIEHLTCPITTMNEIYRVLKPGGMADLLVPSSEGRGACQDPTHIYNPQTKAAGSMWNENSFLYYSVVPIRPEDPECKDYESHPLRKLYPQMITAAFDSTLGTSAPDAMGIIYVAAKLTKVVLPECPVQESNESN